MKKNRNIPVRIATTALATSIALTTGMPVYADSTITSSGGSGDVGITFTFTMRDFELDDEDSNYLDSDSLKDITATYDGEEHSSYEPDAIRNAITGLRAGEDPADIKIEYSTDGGATWSEDVPSITDAGTQNVKIKASMETYNDLIIDMNIVVAKKDASIKFSTSSVSMNLDEWDRSNPDLSVAADYIALTGFVDEPVLDTDFEITADMTAIPATIAAGTTYTDALVISYPKTGTTFNFNNYNITTNKAGAVFHSADLMELFDSVVVSGISKEYDGTEDDAITFSAKDGYDETRVQELIAAATVEYSLDGGSTWTTSKPKNKNVGTQNIKVRFTLSGETLIWAAGQSYTCTVFAREITIKPDDVTVEENEAAPTTYTYKALYHGYEDTPFNAIADGETLSVTFVNSHQSETGTGTWEDAISVSGTATITDGSGTDTTSNYSITYGKADYKRINTKYEALKESLTVTPYSATYDGNSHNAVSVSGDYISEATVSYSTDGGTTYTSTMPTLKDVETRNIIVKVELGSQEALTRTVTSKVTAKAVTVAANKAEKEEDATTYPTYTATVTGVVSGQNYTYTIANTKETETAVGTYSNAIVVSDLVVTDDAGTDTTSNYNITYKTADYEITNGEFKDLQASFKVTGYSGTYDGAEHGLTISGTTEHTVLIYSTDAGITWETEAPTAKNVEDSRTVYVRAYIASDTSKYITKRANLKVSKRAAKITVNAASKTQGEDDPKFTATVTGIVAGESFSYHIERTDDSETVGTHTIKAVLDEEYPNYQITLKSGYLTIKASASTNSIKNIRVTGYSGYYDGAAHTVDINLDSADGVTIEYSTDGGASWSTEKPYITNVADSTTVQVRASNGQTTKTVSTAISIKRAKATIIVDDVTVGLREAYPEFTATVDGIVDGTVFDYTIEADEVAKAGTYRNAIKLTLNNEYPNYQITIKNGTLTVTGAGAIEGYTNDNLIDKGTVIDLVSDGLTLITEPEDEIVMIARFDAIDDTAFVDAAETRTVTNPDKAPDNNKKKTKAGDAAPYVIGAIVAGAIAVGLGVTGGFSALWLLLLGLLFKKKRKHWSGLLTYTSNWAMNVKGDTDGAEDMQDILNKGVTIDELKTVMEGSGIETILPANTKMSIDIEGVENEFDADEETFYNELVGKSGHAIVTFFNGAAKLSFTVTMDLH